METFLHLEQNSSPKDYDLAIVPINEYGSIGNLNAMVLMAYGYDEAILKTLDLKKGYAFFKLNSKPILFVVTINERESTAALLKKNLHNALQNTVKEFYNLNIWLPLLGTGTGKLTYEESYRIIAGVIRDLGSTLVNSDSRFTIAVPDDKPGSELLARIQSNGLELDLINEDILKKSMHKFFLVGSSWNGDEQSARFYNEGLWETGYDDKYTKIINSVKAGDFLIHKSTYPNREGETYLRFKGWGRVIENQQDGTSLIVRWVDKGHKIDVKDMGYYRNTIAAPTHADMKLILDTLPQSISKKIISALSEGIGQQEPTQLAGLISDADSGEDYLDIMPDVNSFALVLAAKSFQPPLALALLGRWGSGKSFFMKKLKDQVAQLCGSDKEYFCEGIVHVHFNAWSYMDANLWASITTRIFEGLNQYILEDSTAKQNVKEIERKLTKDLSVTKDEVTGLENQKNEIDNQLTLMYDKKSKAKNILDSKIKALRKMSLQNALKTVDDEFDVESRIKEAITQNPGVVEDVERFKKIVPEAYWQKPEELYERVRSVPAFVRLFTRSSDKKFNRWWALITLLLLIAVPALVLFIQNFYALHTVYLHPGLWVFVTLIGTTYYRFAQVYKKVRPFLARMWSIREAYLKQRDEAVSLYNQGEKALSYEIDFKKNELELLENQISSVKVIQSTIEFKISHALSTEALYEFIDKRCNSEDYKKHLGLVSIIRKDFEILSSLITGHKEELAKTGDAEKFKSLFDKPLERIILYIDDLDRCPEDRVIEVLEAVNLLMAYPLFIVVVGVDPIWVRNALTVRYKQQFNYEDDGFKCIEPSDYLEKIFQIAFHLKKAEDSYIKEMLKGLAEMQVIPSSEGDEGEEIDDVSGDKRPITDLSHALESEASSAVGTKVITAISKEIIVQALSFSKRELSRIQGMSVILGNSPRLIKRYINIYRIIKSHDYIRKGRSREQDMELILFLLALSLSVYRKLLPSVSMYLETGKHNDMFSDYLGLAVSTTADESNVAFLKSDLLKMLTKHHPELLKEKVADMKRHINFIKRFTF